jgi:hypothetical protein
LQRVLSTVTLLGLLVASAAAFAITEHLKLIKSPVYAPQVTRYVSPICGCATDRATISVKFRRRTVVTVRIVDAHQRPLATLVSQRSVPRGQGTWTWDGRTAGGARVPDGTYRPEIVLPHRTYLLSVDRITVDTTAPRVLSAGVSRTLIIGGKKGVPIHYVFSQAANALVYLGRQQVVLGHPTRAHDKVRWSGRRAGRLLGAGRYVLTVAARDAAGNETPPSGRKRVVVLLRYIEVAQTRIHVGAGAHFTVGIRTAAPKFSWRFAGKHGTGHGKTLHVRAPSRHGKFRLVVTEQGHSASAIVSVGRR